MTGLSGLNKLSNSQSDMPCGCSDCGRSLNKSTTFTNRTFTSGRCWHYPSIRCQLSFTGIFWKVLGQPSLLGYFVQSGEPVGRSLVRTEQAEVIRVLAHHVA